MSFSLPEEIVEQRLCALDTCPVSSAIAGKWKPAVIRALQLAGTMRFGQLRRAIPGVTQKMLTQQLRELEADGLVWRKVYAEVPPRVEYGRASHKSTPCSAGPSYARYGKTLDPVLAALANWGEGHRGRG